MGQTRRTATATAMSRCSILTIDTEEMARQLRARPALSKAFLAHVLMHNIRVEEDLLDQPFNSAEKPLARTLLLLARRGEPHSSRSVLPRVSQELLAEMVGTTRSRVTVFMNKFRKLGVIHYNSRCDGALEVSTSLLKGIVHDGRDALRAP